jgi:glycosyltransferase involved in cell wall biosynthesis
MKIISIGPAFPYRGGLATFNDRLTQQLTSEGHDIEIFTFSLQYPKILFPGKTQYTDGPAPAGIRITRNINSVNPFNWIRTGLRLRKLKPDIVLFRFWLPFMGPCFGTISLIARSNNHSKVICIFDNVIPHEKRPGDRILTRYFTGKIDAAIVMSDTVLADLKSFRPDIPVKLSPHPMFDNYGKIVQKEDAAKRLNLEPGFSYLLFFGFIREYKGLDLLLHAFSDTRLRKFKIKLIVAGEFYEDSAPYKSIVKDSDCEKDVIFYDQFIKDDEVNLFFSIADLVVQPYKSATQSGVTQIAYFFEKPMLVTAVGGLKEIVPDGKCGYVVMPEAEAISGAILDFYENNRKDWFTEGVRQERERFTWDKMTASLLDLYSILNSYTESHREKHREPQR